MGMPLDNTRLIDLTQFINPGCATWDLSCRFHLQNDIDYKHGKKIPNFKVQSITIPLGIGTHMDAPSHCIPDGYSIDQLPLNQLYIPCVHIDLSHRCQQDLLINVKDIQEFEQQHGVIERGTFVLFSTGWAQYWNQPKKYHNDYIFPYVHQETASLLVDREVSGIGIDTLSPDRPSKGFDIHRILLSQGIFIVENVASAFSIPAKGGIICAFPLKIQGATESPLRLVGMIP